MILAALLALAPLSQEAGQSPQQVLSQMIKRYYDAQSLGGTFSTLVEWDKERLVIETELWYERPGKLFLRQTTNLGFSFLVTADGQEFSYDKPLSGIPEDLAAGGRLMEAQVGRTIADVYTISSLSIAERSTPLDLAIARIDDLRMLRNQWVTVEEGGTEEVDGVAHRKVVGKWTSNPEYGVLGTYALWVGPQGDLRRVLIQGKDDDGKLVTRRHEVDLKVGAQAPEGKFKVVRHP
jgi:outer membrane lipoprotein-sorting protein